jgi:hypothetical protein
MHRVNRITNHLASHNGTTDVVATSMANSSSTVAVAPTTQSFAKRPMSVTKVIPKEWSVRHATSEDRQFVYDGRGIHTSRTTLPCSLYSTE